MVDQLQERIEREARFNSDVSHELRSPLTTLAAALEVLEADRDDLPARSQRALQLLSDDLRRFQRMVGDLLEMSRADAGSVDVFLEEVHVAELVQRSVETGFGHMVSHGDTGRAARGARSTPPCAPGTSASTSAASSGSWSTCMENADHYGGGCHRSVGAAARRPATAALVEVTVDDAGPGIDPLERTQGLRPLLPGLGVGPARHGHRHRAGPRARRRAHARHARRRPRRVLPGRAAPASS